MWAFALLYRWLQFCCNIQIYFSVYNFESIDITYLLCNFLFRLTEFFRFILTHVSKSFKTTVFIHLRKTTFVINEKHFNYQAYTKMYYVLMIEQHVFTLLFGLNLWNMKMKCIRGGNENSQKFKGIFVRSTYKNTVSVL